MNREIKFRGLSENVVWHIGSYHKCVGSGEMPDVTWNNGNRTIDYKPVEFNCHWILEDQKPSDSGWDIRDSFTAYSVKPVTVGQFTCLKDKSGVEIYEGDILQTCTDKAMVVSWSNHYASFVLNREGWAFSHWFGESCQPEDCIVIGNIHEHPHLLTP